MNDEDIKRFARYKPGFIEPLEDDEKNKINSTKLGYIEEININKEELVQNAIKNPSKTDKQLKPPKNK